MIFVDSNVPMYLIGAPYPHKIDARRFLEECVTLQEILQRYVAINRREAIQPAFDALLSVVDEVLPVELAQLHRARDIVLGVGRLSARDALHVAVMEAHGIDTILTFDRGFDGFPGVRRYGA